MFSFFRSYKLRNLARYLLWFLLIITSVFSFLNFMKPTPQNMGVDNLTRYSFRLSTLAQSFATEFLTYQPKDETYLTRVSPFIGKGYDVTQLIDLDKVTGNQKVINTWITSTSQLTDNIYVVKVGASVLSSTAADGSNPVRRNFIVGVPFEMVKDGSAYVNGSPTILPMVETQSVNGLSLGAPIPNQDPEIANTVKNFMSKLTTDKNHEDLANFIDSQYNIKPMNQFVSFIEVKDVRAYDDLDFAGAKDGLKHYVVTTRVVMKDDKTGHIFNPDYMFKMYNKDGKYYISWMSYQPFIR